MNPKGLIFIGFGAALVGVGMLAERYHNKKFIEHRRRLEQAETDEEIQQEMKRFKEERKVNWAIDILPTTYILGVILVMLGFVVIMG